VNRRVVSDAGPLIALARIGRLDLLRKALGSLEIAQAVEDELRLDSDMPGATLLRRAVRKDGWIRARTVSTAPARLGMALGLGEASAILLAAERKALLLIDDRRGRTAAAKRGVICIGTGRVLLEAKRRRLLTAVGPTLQALTDSGYRLSPALCSRILELAGEAGQ